MVTLWHLTTKKDWELDPTYHPVWAYLMTGGPHTKPGIFVTDFPSYWQPIMGVGPIYAVRVEVPEEAMPPTSYTHPEFLITDVDKVRIVEILPLAEAILRGEAEKRAKIPSDRQEYGRFGHVDDWWYVRSEVWDDEKMTLVEKFYPRRGLSRLMETWRERTGYKNPRDEYEKIERAKRKAR